MYLLTPGGAPCSKLVLFTIFIQQTPFSGGATFGRWNNSTLWWCNFEILVWILYQNMLKKDFYSWFFKFSISEMTTFREWVHYRYGTYSEVGFESDPLYPSYYQSGPLEKASVGCRNLTQDSNSDEQMVDTSILRNKVRNWYLEIETTLTLSKSSQTVVPWVWGISDFHPVKWGVIQNQRLCSSNFLRRPCKFNKNLPHLIWNLLSWR